MKTLTSHLRFIEDEDLGDWYDLHVFEEMVDNGTIIDSDGTGYFGDGEWYSDDHEVFVEDTTPEWATGVMWFNK